MPYDYITNSSLCFDVWTVRKLATDTFSRDGWDIYDTVNYARVNKHHGFHHNFDDNSRIIEDENDDDYNGNTRDNDYDPWNQYQIYGSLFIILF